MEAEDICGAIHWGISKATIWMTYRAGFITGTMMLINHRTILTTISKTAVFPTLLKQPGQTASRFHLTSNTRRKQLPFLRVILE